MTKNCLRIGITAGEPAGIGPDLCLLLAQEVMPVQCVIIADPLLLAQRADQLRLSVIIQHFSPENNEIPPVGTLLVYPVYLKQACRPTILDVNNSSYVLETLAIAVKSAQAGLFNGIVTGPVHKGIINKGGVAFTGHTEYFAEQTNTQRVVMMLANQQLKVALATTHLPLIEVSKTLTKTVLQEVLYVLHESMQKYFGLSQPKIGICGLNPHAGEDGYLGNEEQKVMNPVITQLRQQGMNLSNPLPADTLFIPQNRRRYDVILAMYHDQGLPVLKSLDFGQGVNITLGLPIIRTSVDHGTALELAGTGKANHHSLMSAINMAVAMNQI